MKNNYTKNKKYIRTLLCVLVLLIFMRHSGVDAQSYSVSDTTTVYNTWATYYADKFVGRKTSSGEVFYQDKFTAAHHSIKLGTLVLVTNPKTGSQVIVKVNDRCPRKGVIDLTRRAIKAVDIKGSDKVKIRILSPTWKSAWEKQLEGESVKDVPLEIAVVNEKEERVKPKEEKSQKQPMLKRVGPIEEPPTKVKNEVKEQPVPKLEKKSSSKSSKANQKYDLQIATGVPRVTAQSLVDKLPMQYQNSVKLVPDRATGKVNVRLELYTSRQKAIAIQKKLHKNFPDSELIEVDL